MEVRNVRWVGIRTDHYEAMVGFLRDVLGLRTNFEEPTTIEFTTSEGDGVQVMAPGHPYYEFFGKEAHGPVPLFEVDDVHAARRELEAVDIDVVGSTEHDSRWEWIHVRAPDGNLYEFASRRPRREPPELSEPAYARCAPSARGDDGEENVGRGPG